MKKRFKLQDFGDGAIYRNLDHTYTIEISHGKVTAGSVEECLKQLSKQITPVEVKSTKKQFKSIIE